LIHNQPMMAAYNGVAALKIADRLALMLSAA